MGRTPVFLFLAKVRACSRLHCTRLISSCLLETLGLPQVCCGCIEEARCAVHAISSPRVRPCLCAATALHVRVQVPQALLPRMSRSGAAWYAHLGTSRHLRRLTWGCVVRRPRQRHAGCSARWLDVLLWLVRNEW